MSLSQADKQRLEAANLQLGGAVEDVKAARRIIGDPRQTRIARAEAAGRESAFTAVIERLSGVRI